MVDREQIVMDLLLGKLQTSWSYCDPSCASCKFYHGESDMGARVPICVHGLGRSKESCGCYMTQHEYLEFVRSGFANLKAENAKLRELVHEVALMNGSPTFWEHFDPYSFWQGWTSRARELGIEVDG